MDGDFESLDDNTFKLCVFDNDDIEAVLMIKNTTKEVLDAFGTDHLVEVNAKVDKSGFLI